MKPESEGLLDAVAAVVAVIGHAGNLAAEEVVEEVLEVVRALAVALIAAAIGILGVGQAAEAVAAPILGLLGEGLGIDIDHRGADQAGDLDVLIGGDGGVDHLEGGCVDAAVLLLLATYAVGGKGAGHDSHRKGGQQDKGGSEMARAQPCRESFHGFR